MEQYIPKSALVAEIERMKNQFMSQADSFHKLGMEEKRDYYAKLASNMYSILSFIDTLEVREVDLEREINDYFITVDLCKGEEITENTFSRIAKHFFELGLRSTITEEDCKLIWNIGDDLPYMSEEEFFKELLRRYKAQKGEEV